MMIGHQRPKSIQPAVLYDDGYSDTPPIATPIKNGAQ
jgi:hypothetical protein